MLREGNSLEVGEKIDGIQQGDRHPKTQMTCNHMVDRRHVILYIWYGNVCIYVVDTCLCLVTTHNKKRESIWFGVDIRSKWYLFHLFYLLYPLGKNAFSRTPACHWAAWLRHSRRALCTAPRCQPPAAPHCVPLPTSPSCPGKLGSDAMGLCHRLPSRGIGLHPCSPMTTSSV